MRRKIFISFLGTGRYTRCNYHWKEIDKIDDVAFIQTAMGLVFCKEFCETDQFIIFLTKKARDVNWDKLREEMRERSPMLQLTPIDIPEGHTEKEIWDIFEIVFKQIHAKDLVTLDVTHAFRSIPMLGVVLLNYAKFLKNITVNGIYYGAFEVLGNPAEVKTLPMEERNAPIFDLTAFDQLQQWSAAADNFVSGGNPGKIVDLLNQLSKAKLVESHGTDPFARKTRDLASNLEKLYSQLSTVRGIDVRKGTAFRYACKEVDELFQSASISTLSPLLERMREKLDGFRENETFNGLKATRLCLDFGLVQQGITLLQETIITHLAEITSELKYLDKQHRELVSSALHILENNIPESRWKDNVSRNKTIVRTILNSSKAQTLSPLYRNLTQLRNDINHGGYIQPRPPEQFSKKLSQFLDEVEAILS